ncbi:hypothetical protein BD410DRAFT_782713 [Rickenella mellea]|uniref:Uncharacterized protein n=1 Tax=Rickenella mellea TaxID=50990 RepID=A0A4Y7QK28_9AGAM|nr:hypothetical protein BD410DRAFT_782713 [Rickenella mellea]
MEIDMHSPPLALRPMDNVSLKRARSPSSPPPGERVTKRLSLAPHAAPFHYDSQPGWIIGSPCVSNCRRASDDWVTRTRRLSIESPHAGSTLALPEAPTPSTEECFQFNRNNENDVQMSTADIEDDSRVEDALNAYDSYDSSCSTPSIEISDAFGHLSHIHQPHLSHLPPSLPTAPDTHPQQLSLPLPQINIQPATPSGLTPIDCQTPETMVGEPASSNSRMKRTLTMGPRADCEKCRLRIPGHWMHFD